MAETTQTSEQIKKLTSSQDGTGRVTKLQPKSHFFLRGGNQVNDFTQTKDQSFGVLSTTQFRTTATVLFSGVKDIYALCMGTVFIQPGGETDRVNLILRPFKQPINGLNIKYIVYRGLNKSDFISSDGKVAGSETAGSGFTKYIWTQFNKFYDVSNGEEAPEFKSIFLGYPNTQEELKQQEKTHLIDQYFFKKTSFTDADIPEEELSTAYELPVIPRGLHLGKALGTVGIDIVLNDGDYTIENDNSPFKLNLEYARASEYTLDTSLETDTFRKKLLKEAATKFIDVVAFYGLHANGVGKLYVDETEIPLTTKIDVATRLQNFYTKNTFYLYIYSNRQRSYNFYENYTHSQDNSNTIKIGTRMDSLIETTFRTNDWPIHTINQNQDSTTENNTIIFQLTTDNYDGAALFAQIGELVSPQEDNFVRGVNLLKKGSEDDAVVIDVNYTQSIQISTPAIEGNTIAAFSQFIYEGKQMIVQEETVPVTSGEDSTQFQAYYLKDIDDAFGLICVKSVFDTQSTQLPTIINENLKIINFFNGAEGIDVAAIKQGRIEDRIRTIDESIYLDRVTFESNIYSIKRNTSSHLKNTAYGNDNIKASFKNFQIEQNDFYKPQLPYKLQTQLFTESDGVNAINGLFLYHEEGKLVSKRIVGITQEEEISLKKIISDNNLINPFLFFKDELYSSNDFYTSNEGYQYKKFKLGIIGESSVSSNSVYFPDSDILIYTTDNNVYFTKQYSLYVSIEDPFEDVALINIIEE